VNIEAMARELEALRKFAGGQMSAPQVIETLGPMSLWSKAGFNAEMQRVRAEALEEAAALCERDRHSFAGTQKLASAIRSLRRE